MSATTLPLTDVLVPPVPPTAAAQKAAAPEVRARRKREPDQPRRVTIEIPGALHLRIRVSALSRGLNLGDAVIEALSNAKWPIEPV
jgi:hypothetical protein